jgi:hypothetical protein
MLLKGFAPGLEDALLALAGPESTAPSSSRKYG